MKLHHDGSMLLIIMIVMSALVVYALSAWRTTVLLVERAHAREQYEYLFQATQVLLEYAVALSKQNFDAIKQRFQTKKDPFTITFKPWPISESSVKGEGLITITTDHDGPLSLHALTKQADASCALRCTIERKISDKKVSFYIDNWQYVHE